ncbi:MAG: metallophosphoesterase [Gammaproteobacteria bacterium]
MQKKQWKCFSTIILAVISVHLPAAPQPSVEDTAKFLSVADIHFDPFSGCSIFKKPCESLTKLREANYQDWPNVFEHYGEHSITSAYHDTNYPLLKSSLTAIDRVSKNEHPKFVLILGDFLAHDFHKKYVRYSGDKSRQGFENFVKKTLQFMTYEFAKEFPTIDVYPVVGNNDSYTGDYRVVPHGRFFQDVTDIWSTLIKNDANRESFKKDFPSGGYYVISIPNHANQKIIALNTVMFSSHIKKASVQKAASTQLEWLQKQLLKADKQKQQVMIIDHIPVGIDAFATIKNSFNTVKQFWQPNYTTQFENDVSHYPTLISGIFSGHIHMDTFQSLTLKKVGDIPIYITPSISPIYGNNPGFKLFTYEVKTLKVQSAEDYYYPLSENLENQWEKKSL